MKSYEKLIAAFICFIITSNLLAQNIDQLPWQERDRKDAQPLPHEYQREADVFWSKTIWRIIDVRQKMNLPFAYPQQPLIQIIHEAALKGQITVYDPTVLNADQFKTPMDSAAIAKEGVRDDTIPLVDPQNPDREVMTAIHNPLTWDKIKKYRIKEVWFFDTKTSTMQVRIIAIAPVMEDYDNDNNYRGDMTMYWVYYPDLRNILSKYNVYNSKNDSQRFSWDDLFEMRLFESYIYKESNVYDRNVQEYASGADAQLESERIKQELFEKEHDMWEY